MSAGAQDLLLGTKPGLKPAEPFRQLWIAGAIVKLDDVEIVKFTTRPLAPCQRLVQIPAGRSGLILLTVSEGEMFTAEIGGSPLIKMTISTSSDNFLVEQGALRAVTIPVSAGSLIQILLSNQGVSASSAIINCSLI